MNDTNNVLSAISEQSKDFALMYSKQLVYGVLGAVVFGLGIFGYAQYSKHLQSVAQGELAAALRFVDAPVVPGAKTTVEGDAIEFATAQDKWTHVNKTFADGYAKNRSAGISSIFLVYQAEALLNLGKRVEALDVLSKAIDAMPNDELKDFYKVKRALMKIDSEQALDQKDGLEELRKLSSNQNSVAHEQALYYLGSYFWTQKDFTQAKNYWQQLIVKYGMRDTHQASPYVDAVRSKLRLISAEW